MSVTACFRQLLPILSPDSQAVLNLVDTVLDREHTLALDVAAVYEGSQLSFCRAGPTLTKSPSQSRLLIRVFLKPELVDESAPARGKFRNENATGRHSTKVWWVGN